MKKKKVLKENEALRALIDVNNLEVNSKEFNASIKKALSGGSSYHVNNMSLALEIANIAVSHDEFRPKAEGISGVKGRKKHLKKVFKIVLNLIH